MDDTKTILTGVKWAENGCRQKFIYAHGKMYYIYNVNLLSI